MRTVKATLTAMALSIGGTNMAYSSSFEASFKEEVIKNLTERSMKEGRVVANSSCIDGVNLISKELAKVGSARGFNSVLDATGILLAATKASDREAYRKLVRVLVNSDDVKSELNKYFYLDEETSAACDSFTTYRELVKHAKK